LIYILTYHSSLKRADINNLLAAKGIVATPAEQEAPAADTGNQKTA